MGKEGRKVPLVGRGTEQAFEKMAIAKSRGREGSHFRWEGEGSMNPTDLSHMQVFGILVQARGPQIPLEGKFHKGSS